MIKTRRSLFALLFAPLAWAQNYRYPKPKYDRTGTSPSGDNTALADRITQAIVTDPHAVLEIRPNGDGTFRAVLNPEVVKSDVLRVLEIR